MDHFMKQHTCRQDNIIDGDYEAGGWWDADEEEEDAIIIAWP